jgi:hypothetical protein
MRATAVDPYRYGLPILSIERISAWCSHERSAGFKVQIPNASVGAFFKSLFFDRDGAHQLASDSYRRANVRIV